MNDLEHARSLLAMADKDFKALVGMGNGEAFDDEIFGGSMPSRQSRKR